jgi:hypothetical protein
MTMNDWFITETILHCNGIHCKTLFTKAILLNREIQSRKSGSLASGFPLDLPMKTITLIKGRCKNEKLLTRKYRPITVHCIWIVSRARFCQIVTFIIQLLAMDACRKHVISMYMLSELPEPTLVPSEWWPIRSTLFDLIIIEMNSSFRTWSACVILSSEHGPPRSDRWQWH